MAIACTAALWAAAPQPASASDVFQLITKDEAALPTDDTYSRGITRGPHIVQVSPPPESGELQSPVRLVIRFKGRGGVPIDPESLVVTYMKRPAIDLTQRIEPFINADGIDIEDAGMPPGHHRIDVTIKDDARPRGAPRLHHRRAQVNVGRRFPPMSNVLTRATDRPPKVCISYRRSNSMAITGRIFDRLVSHFGSEAIFMDIDDIPFGVDFREHIDTTIRESDVLVAVVGAAWLGPRDRRRGPYSRTGRPGRHRNPDGARTAGPHRPGPRRRRRHARQIPASREARGIRQSQRRRHHLRPRLQHPCRSSDPRHRDAERQEESGARCVRGPQPPLLVQAVRPRRVGSLALLAIAAVLAAHYLIVVKLDLDDIYLRAAVFVIGAGFGSLTFAPLGRNLALVLLGGFAVGLLSVLGMLTVVGLIDGVSILPSGVAEWQETAEYLATIIIGTGLGATVTKIAPFRKPTGSTDL